MKERSLTILVPIKSTDVTATYQNLASLVNAVPPSAAVVNNIFSVGAPVFGYVRAWLNPSTSQYEYKKVVDREFPEIGKPLEIFDFTYDSVRMEGIPVISAQNVMWYAEKDQQGNDVTLENLWTLDCRVTFSGENFYLKRIPTSGKSNEDARYKYDIDFVSERVVLEQVYLYDVVTPYITEKPISESYIFNFFGAVTKFAQ